MIMQREQTMMSDNDVVKNRVPAFDATYMAFLLLEGLYASKEINLKTYTNILSKKRDFQNSCKGGS